MNNGSQEDLTKLQEEFVKEEKGEGSMSVYVSDTYLGYDINPEDVEALFFEGIGVPRWDSIEAANVDDQHDIYMERYNALMEKFPLLGRANDTLVGSEFEPGEVNGLVAECQSIIGSASEPKAVRAAQKFAIAAQKAADAGSALKLKPSGQ